MNIISSRLRLFVNTETFDLAKFVNDAKEFVQLDFPSKYPWKRKNRMGIDSSIYVYFAYKDITDLYNFWKYIVENYVEEDHLIDFLPDWEVKITSVLGNERLKVDSNIVERYRKYLELAEAEKELHLILREWEGNISN